MDASAAGGVIHEWRKFLKPPSWPRRCPATAVPGEVVGIRLARMGRGGFELEAGGGTRVAYLGHATRRRGVVGSSSSRGGE